MEFSMIADFRILKNDNGNFVPVAHDEVDNIATGGYSFVVGGETVPFDWDAFSVDEHEQDDCLFRVETGLGFLFNDFELPDYWDDEYAEMGLSRQDITAEFLASASSIDDFFVYFDDESCSLFEECYAGDIEDNADPNVKYHVELLNVKFVEIETGKEYTVRSDVLEAFNRGEKAREFSADDREASEENARNDKITVLVVEPGKRPYEKEIDSGLKSLQREVGGDIQAVYPFEEPVALLCNDDAKLLGMPLNRALRDEDGDIYDIVAGTFLIAGLGKENFGSLEAEHMQHFKEHFGAPERFLKRGEQIEVVANDLDARIRDYAAATRKGGDDDRERSQSNEERGI